MITNVSLICVYNKKSVYNDILIESLKKQTIKCELIGIDNSNGRFSSAAAALNYGVTLSHGNLLIFVHQDIEFTTEHSLEELIKRLSVLERGDVAGVAGEIVLDGKRVCCTSITFGKHRMSYKAIPINETREVESLDECLFAMLRETWEDNKLNESVCNGWHFYAVEACYHARKHNHHVYVVKSSLNHLSASGTLDNGYYSTLSALCEHYKNSFPYIVSTTTYIRTAAYKKDIAIMRLKRSVKKCIASKGRIGKKK